MRHWWGLLLVGLAIPANAQAPVPARPASEFADSVGMNTHLRSKWDTAYSDCANAPSPNPPCPASVARIAGALRSIGVVHIRDSIPKAYVADRVRQLADAVPGLRLDLLVGDDKDGSLEDQIALAASVADLVDVVEGPNEPNNAAYKFRYHGHPFPSGVSEAMRDLAGAVANSPLAGAPIANSALGGGTGADAGRLGVVPEAAFATAHAYAGVGAPHRFTRGLTPARTLAPDRPMLITETGTCTPPKLNFWCAVSEAVQAKYTLMLLADAFDVGVRRTYLYELVDERPDPAGDDNERHFGLFHVDWSPKPAGSALANLRREVGGGGRPGQLAYGVAGARSILLRREDGTFLVVAWVDTDLWDEGRRLPIEVGPRPFVLKLATRPASVAAFDPMDGSRHPLKAGVAVDFELPDHPIVLEVKPN